MKLFAAPFTAALLMYAQGLGIVPVDQEPQHKVVFKNDFVRVLDATLPPGYVTLNHRHDIDSVSVMVANGRGGETGRAGFSKGGYSHTVTNSGQGITRFIVVEIVKTDHPNANAADLPKHTLETENDRVRIYRVKIPVGEALSSHTHTAGWMEVTVAGPEGAGASVWHAAGENHPLNAGGSALELVEIQPK
jgi:hypothetical protein